MSRAAEIVAELRADPTLADAVIASIDVARAWEPQQYQISHLPDRPVVDAYVRVSAKDPRRNLAAVCQYPDGAWDWWHQGKSESWRREHDDAAATAEEAMRRADGGLDVQRIPRIGGGR